MSTPPFRLVDLGRDRADRLVLICLVVASVVTLPLLVATPVMIPMTERRCG